MQDWSQLTGLLSGWFCSVKSNSRHAYWTHTVGKAQRKSDPPFQDKHGGCCDFMSISGQPGPNWECLVPLFNLEGCLFRYALVVDAYDQHIFASVKQVWIKWWQTFLSAWLIVEGFCPHCLPCQLLWVAQTLSDRSGGGSLFHLWEAVKQWPLDFISKLALDPMPPCWTCQN